MIDWKKLERLAWGYSPEEPAGVGVAGAPEQEVGVGQFYKVVQPVVPLPKTSSLTKALFMFQVYTGGKLVTSTSGESLGAVEALIRRYQLLAQFGNCQNIPKLALPQSGQVINQPAELTCPSKSSVQVGNRYVVAESRVRVFQWNGSGWDEVIWKANQWQKRFLIVDESLRGLPEDNASDDADGTLGQFYKAMQPFVPNLTPKCSYVVQKPRTIREVNDVFAGKWAEEQVAFLASRCGLTVGHINSLNGNQPPSSYWVPGKAVVLPYCICDWIEKGMPMTPEEFENRFEAIRTRVPVSPQSGAYRALYGMPDEDGTVGQFYRSAPVKAAPALPAAAIKKTFMFQVFTGNKLITSTSAETLNDIQSLQRRKQLFNQFAECNVTQFQLPLTPEEFSRGFSANEPQYLECFTGIVLPGLPPLRSGVRVYLWDGSKWNVVFWNVNRWEQLGYLPQQRPDRSGPIYR